MENTILIIFFSYGATFAGAGYMTYKYYEDDRETKSKGINLMIFGGGLVLLCLGIKAYMWISPYLK